MLIIWTTAFEQPYGIGTISIPILQIKKLRPKESAQCHNNQQVAGTGFVPVLLVPKLLAIMSSDSPSFLMFETGVILL